jgi:hypothetical protein
MLSSAWNLVGLILGLRTKFFADALEGHGRILYYIGSVSCLRFKRVSSAYSTTASSGRLKRVNPTGSIGASMHNRQSATFAKDCEAEVR